MKERRQKSVVALIVTYNRKKLLINVIENLLNQNYNLDGILVFDNNSNDGTEKLLLKEKYIDQYQKEKITSKRLGELDFYYYKNGENLGGAGGFSKGVEIISQMQYDYVWIMDDDVLPEKNCLKVMLDTMEKYNVHAAIPNRNSENFKDCPVVDLDMKSFSKYFINDRKKRVELPLSKDVYFVKTMAFEGPLVDMNIIRKIGYPNSEYFILFDDTDYAQRILQFTNIAYCVDAHLYRQLPFITSKEKNKKFGWKEYYAIRNNILFNKKYGENFVVKYISSQMIVLYMLQRAVRNLNIKDVLLVLKASIHGNLGITGKKVQP
ncbi:glycosyltransferase [Ligilactobacillus hayakitensis DSM 18933 = JCM 14209]|uniref:Glycosyltransferase n=1 Tax=Ligilactobacillus hayakitensis DSM 18933 = JCM 14209 TaxID=1423755 RepID=A0A0R1WQH0_9LACO|nr:glycosyltransferase family 2 protein [Ligilactobacillus hayakitensis]KRM20128.1 glycosyltransferase [Ligilactobacillus hayakitensis DSM 18933 = JCM 14209]